MARKEIQRNSLIFVNISNQDLAILLPAKQIGKSLKANGEKRYALRPNR